MRVTFSSWLVLMKTMINRQGNEFGAGLRGRGPEQKAVHRKSHLAIHACVAPSAGIFGGCSLSTLEKGFVLIAKLFASIIYNFEFSHVKLNFFPQLYSALFRCIRARYIDIDFNVAEDIHISEYKATEESG